MRKIGQDERPVVLILYPLMANFVLMGAAMPFVYEPMPAQDLGLLAVIAVLAIVATNFLILAYRSAPAATVAPMQYSQIIWASAYGALFFGEALEPATLLGTSIIVASRHLHRLPRGSGRALDHHAGAADPVPVGRTVRATRGAVPVRRPARHAAARDARRPGAGQRLTPLQCPRVGAIPRGTVGV